MRTGEGGRGGGEGEGLGRRGKRLEKSRGKRGRREEGREGEVGRDKTELPPRRLGDDLGGSKFILIS